MACLAYSTWLAWARAARPSFSFLLLPTSTSASIATRRGHTARFPPPRPPAQPGGALVCMAQPPSPKTKSKSGWPGLPGLRCACC